MIIYDVEILCEMTYFENDTLLSIKLENFSSFFFEMRKMMMMILLYIYSKSFLKFIILEVPTITLAIYIFHLRLLKNTIHHRPQLLKIYEGYET